MEAEVVGTSEYFPYKIWLLMFLLYQGYSIGNNIFINTPKVLSKWKDMGEVLVLVIQDT